MKMRTPYLNLDRFGMEERLEIGLILFRIHPRKSSRSSLYATFNMRNLYEIEVTLIGVFATL
jgi:hypothetical protein